MSSPIYNEVQEGPNEFDTVYPMGELGFRKRIYKFTMSSVFKVKKEMSEIQENLQTVLSSTIISRRFQNDKLKRNLWLQNTWSYSWQGIRAQR